MRNLATNINVKQSTYIYNNIIHIATWSDHVPTSEKSGCPVFKLPGNFSSMTIENLNDCLNLMYVEYVSSKFTFDWKPITSSLHSVSNFCINERSHVHGLGKNSANSFDCVEARLILRISAYNTTLCSMLYYLKIEELIIS